MKRQETFDVDGRVTLDVDVKSGSVEVRTGDTRRVAVSLDGDNVDEWDVEQLGNTITIRPSSHRSWRSRSIRILVETPVGSDVDVDSASADVTLGGELGAVRLRSASGDLRVDTAVRLDAASASGELRVRGVRTEATCSTASGDVDLGDVGGRLTISTASGDVRVASAADDLQIGTASGDVRVGRYDGSVINVKAISGDVRVGLPAGIRVEPDISTLSGRTTLPKPSTRSTSVDPRLVRVRLRTVSGSIDIERVDG